MADSTSLASAAESSDPRAWGWDLLDMCFTAWAFRTYFRYNESFDPRDWGWRWTAVETADGDHPAHASAALPKSDATPVRTSSKRSLES